MKLFSEEMKRANAHTTKTLQRHMFFFSFYNDILGARKWLRERAGNKQVQKEKISII